MLSWLTLLLIGIPVYIISSHAFKLYSNIRSIRKTGINYLAAPVPTEAAPWIILGPMLKDILPRILPGWLWEPVSYTIYGWEFRSGWAPHAKNGLVFFMATTGSPELMIADPDVALDILKRPKEFPMSAIGNVIMGKFGENLLTAKYKTWERMRRFIAPLINERISSTVFQESKTQAEQMTAHIEELKAASTETAEGLKQIAANVLGAAGYGKPRPWTADDDNSEQPPKGFHLTYIQAIRYLMGNLVEMAFISTRLLKLSFMGERLNNTGHAVTEVTALTRLLLEEERNAPSNVGGRASIARLLVEEQNAAEKGTITLHDDEIVGNLFVFSAAGIDTTANTMAYALFMLAAHPDWQDWVIEEIDQVLAGKGDELEYQDIHPKLIRTLALMHETLRIFAPLTHIARGVHQPTDITFDNRTVTLPANTVIYLNSYALHHNPSIWSPNPTDSPPEVFDPARFLTSAANKPSITTSEDKPSSTTATTETPAEAKALPVGGAAIKLPKAKAAFLPWSTGPRVCPGQKMSQVEFVTVFMTILRKYRVEVALKEGERREDALGRVKKVMRDSMPRLTMQMNRPGDVGLRFVRR